MSGVACLLLCACVDTCLSSYRCRAKRGVQYACVVDSMLRVRFHATFFMFHLFVYTSLDTLDHRYVHFHRRVLSEKKDAFIKVHSHVNHDLRAVVVLENGTRHFCGAFTCM